MEAVLDPPGAMAPSPAGVIRALDLSVRRRIEGLLAGEHLSTTLGPGTELAQVRTYQPGDDVRFIDWNVTARTAEPHVRVHVADRALSTWLLLDTSASMDFGTADRTKADVAHLVALAVGHLATRNSNRLGVVTFGGPAAVTLPPASGHGALLGLITTLRSSDGQAARPSSPSSALSPALSPSEGLADVLARVARRNRHRGMVVVVADFRGETGWRRSLVQLCSRHDVLAVEVRDRREQELPDVGEVWFVDPESGRRLRVDTGRAELRQRFSAAAAAERDAVALDVTSAGADHLVLTTEGDWLPPLASFLLRRKQRRGRARTGSAG